MPLDPRIPLGVQAPQIQSPFEAMSQIAEVQARAAAAQEARQKAQDAAAARARAAQVEQRVQGALTVHPTTGRPTLDWAKLLEGGDVPAATLFALSKETDEAATRIATLQTANMTREEKKVQFLATIARPVAVAGYAKPAWDAALLSAFNAGAITAQERDAGYALTDPAEIQRRTEIAIKAAAGDKLEKVETVQDGVAGTRFVAPTPGAFYPTAPKPSDHSSAYKEWQDYQLAGGTLGFDDYMTRDANRKAATIRVNTGSATDDDVDEVISGMMEGTLPPILPGRASPALTKLMAAARRRGFDLAGAATDWSATQKHIATMNGAQQLRLNQAVNALPEMLDNVASLAKQWNGGRFAVLNRANLAAAKGGVYGTKAAEIATQLDAQIADVVADLGNVYMGGNSPTDHALSLAQKSLGADWSEPVLLKMVELAKQNVQIRRNSINNTGVAGASADNPYMPAVPTAPGIPKEGDVKPIPGFPGTEQTYRNGKWIRTK